MKSLFVTMMSYPPIGGEFLRNWQNINIMSNFGSVAVFSVFNRDNNYQGTENKNIEIWHHYNIAKQSSSSAKLELGWQWLRQYGLTYYCPYVRSAAQELDQLMTQFKPDVVVFEQIWVYPYLAVVKRHNCAIIFDNHNIEAPLYEDTKVSGNGLRAWIRKNFHVSQIKSHESELIEEANQVWLCSEEDNSLIQDLYGSIAHSYVVPNGINISDYDCVRLKQCKLPEQLAETKHNILFLGNFLYIPNIEAAEVLIEQIYPRIKQIYPDCRLLLVGRGTTQLMQESSQKDADIIVTGEIPDIRPYLAAATVMLVPLYKGGGTRFKILESFAAGCPVVSTTKGAEGLNAENGQHLLIADDVETMVECIIQIWSNQVLTNQLVAGGYELVQSQYSWDAVSKSVAIALNNLHPFN